MLTVWYEIAAADLGAEVHHSLLPGSDHVRARTRLYDISAETANGEVAFREVVLAFATQLGGAAGEISYEMSTDSVPYLLWGREVYGWPLSLGEVWIPPGFWDEGRPLAGTSDLQFTFERTSGASAVEAAGGPWITPRRHFISPAHWTDEVLLVQPTVLEPGRRFECRADATVSRRWPSAVLRGSQLTLGFVIEVGTDVVTEQRS